MVRCKICRVPLSGFLSKVSKFLFNFEPSKEDTQICNKCADKKASEQMQKKIEKKLDEYMKNQTDKKIDMPAKKPEEETYKCQICGRMIHEKHSLEHVKAEEYLIELIKKDHEHWKHHDPTCKECMEYYRELVKKTEI